MNKIVIDTMLKMYSLEDQRQLRSFNVSNMVGN